MENGLGTIVTGKVATITKFGAFVSLPDNRTGLVHISEIAFTYVNEIREHLTEGQDVKVKIIGVDPEGRINLSIKKAQPRENPTAHHRDRSSGPPVRRSSAPPAPQTFEDKLKAFISDSESKMGDLRYHTEKRPPRRRK